MKRILLFTMCFTFTFGALSAQNYDQIIFTGQAAEEGGDPSAWEDPENWRRGGDPDYTDIPQPGDKILIDGFYVYFNGLGSISQNQEYHSLELRNEAQFFSQGDFHLSDDFIVDVSSTFVVIVQDIDLFKKVTCNFFSFVGRVNLIFSGYAPQIGDSFQVIEGGAQACPSVESYDNFSADFDTLLTTQCDTGGLGVSVEVLDINYIATSWDGEGNDGNWGNPVNWDPNGVPTASSRVIINKPGAGGYVSTSGAGITAVANIILGANNTLEINGDLLVDKYIQVSKDATLLWQGGKIYSNDANVQSGMTSFGNIVLDGPGTKTLDTNFYIWNFFEDLNHNQGDLNINDGYIRMFNFNSYNINGDNINIGYTSGDRHELTISVVSELRKTMGMGISSINLTTFINYGEVISEVGTLAFNEDVSVGEYEEYIDGELVEYIGTFSGSGGFGWPNGYVMDGKIAPGSSPGILTMVGDFATSADATFEIEIDGPNAGTQYDQVNVTNIADLDGEIKVTLGYLPANDASFEIVTAVDLSSCNFPSQINTSYNGTPYTFNVVCFNNSLYLNGPGVTLSSNENILEEELALYPNPASSVLNVKSSLLSKGNWELINQLGQVVKGSAFDGNTIKINVKEIPTGLYFFKIKDDNLKATTIKRIVISN